MLNLVSALLRVIYLSRHFYYNTGLPIHGVKGRPGVVLLGYRAGIKWQMFAIAIVEDIKRAAGAMLCVAALMWW